MPEVSCLTTEQLCYVHPHFLPNITVPPVNPKYLRPCWYNNISMPCQVAAPPETQKDGWLLHTSKHHHPELCGCRIGALSQSGSNSPIFSLHLSIIPIPALKGGKTDKWGKNGGRKAICQLHKFLRLWLLSLAVVTVSYYLESGNRCFPINIKWVGVCGLSSVTRLCWLFTARGCRPCSGSCSEG